MLAPGILTAPGGRRLRRSAPTPLGRVGALSCLAITVALVAAVAGVALHFQLEELERPSGNYDEGVYLESLLLMRHGFRPFTDIVSTQGVLHLDLAYTAYAIGGYTLLGARMGSVVGSIVTLVGVALTGWAVGGRLAAVGAALVVALSPTFLAVSRQALPEAPAAAFAALAVAIASGRALAGRSGRDRWCVASGVLLGLACLVKPAVAPAAVPAVVLAARGGPWRPLLLIGLASAGVAALGLAATGGLGAIDEVVGWRLGSRQLDPSPAVVWHNAELLLDKMYRQEQPALYLLALVGLAALLGRAPRWGFALGGWLVAQVSLLLVYANLSAHLGALLLPPLAALAGVGFGTAWLAVSRRPPRIVPALAALAVAAYLLAIPALIDRDRRLVEGDLSTDRGLSRTERNLVRTIARTTQPDDWVVTDAPYLAFLADRKVPPGLVDPSEARITSGALSEQEVLRVVREYDPEVVLFWTGKLARFNGVTAVVRRDLELIEELEPIDGVPRAIFFDPD